MIQITEHKQNVIYYQCSCGSKGVCSFKPMDKSAAIVMDIQCLACQETNRITLLQYSSESTKQKIMDNIDNVDLSWVLYLNEEM